MERVNWKAVKLAYESTLDPVEDIAAKFNADIVDVRAHANAGRWIDPRNTASLLVPLDKRHEFPTLTEKQQKFVVEAMTDMNLPAAAARAGYAGSAPVGSPNVAAALEMALEARAQRVQVMPDEVLEEVRRLAMIKITDVASWKDDKLKLIDSDLLDPAIAAGIVEVSEGRNGMKIKLVKMEALQALMRHLGMFIDRTEVAVRLPITISALDIDA